MRPEPKEAKISGAAAHGNNSKYHRGRQGARGGRGGRVDSSGRGYRGRGRDNGRGWGPSQAAAVERPRR